jgi:ABC-type transport system involved in cytochrome bd biosynthesis fused ATPase/permease subunit/CRP-like cAMP-binding protein
MTEHGSHPLDRRRFGAPATVISALASTLRRERRALISTLAVIVVAVALGAAVPRLVKALLYHATPTLMVVFILVLVADPLVNLLAHLRASKLSLKAGYDLRTRVFANLGATHPASPDAAIRAKAITNTVADVDRVEHAFESLLIGGVAGVLRIVAAIIFLGLINFPAAVIMASIMPVFFIAQRRLSSRLVNADHVRQTSADHVATIVDESVTAVSTARGLSTGTWFRRRFAVQAHHLDEVSFEQLRLEAKLHLATRVVALVGLASVTILGVWNEKSAGDLLAALLYIELAIVGLESLPPMLRALQQAEASCARLGRGIDEQEPESDVHSARSDSAGVDSAGATLMLVDPNGGRHEIDTGSWVVVVDDGRGPDPVSWLGGLAEPQQGSVLVDGMPAVLAVRARRLASVTSDSKCVDASVMDHLRAIAPDLDEASATDLLERLGIGHLSELADGGLNAPLGIQGALLSSDERQRLLLAMALAAAPGALVTGQLRPLVDPDLARPVIAELRRTGATLLTSSVAEAIAAESDQVLFITDDRWYLATHHSLLMSVPSYVQRWEHGGRDVMSFGALDAAGPLEREAMQNRMVTERYEPGDTIYREGAPADRVVFVVSGRVEIVSDAGTDHQRRVAVIEPGNACGDLRLTADERRAETARAIDLVVVRTIGRAVWEAGMGGLLRADPTERRVLAGILRRGALTLDELVAQLPDDNEASIKATVGALLSDGALRQRPSGELTIGSSKRRSSTSTVAADLLDKIADS